MIRSAKFGAKLRRQVKKAQKDSRKGYPCPKCGKKESVRKAGSYSLWQCRARRCNAIYAGGAYSLTTKVGEVAARLIREYQKAA